MLSHRIPTSFASNIHLADRRIDSYMLFMALDQQRLVHSV